VGTLPYGFDVPWRSSALLQEQTSGPSATDLSGGWLSGEPYFLLLDFVFCVWGGGGNRHLLRIGE